MKAQKHPCTYRMRFRRSLSSPYRSVKRVELDLYQAILIHHQEFPRYHRLYLDDVDIVQEEHDSDSTLIHRMIFPHDFRQPITKNAVKETENFITSRGEPVRMAPKPVSPTITPPVTNTSSVIAQKGTSHHVPAASVGSSSGLSLTNNQTDELCKDQSATISTVGHSTGADEDNNAEVSAPVQVLDSDSFRELSTSTTKHLSNNGMPKRQEHKIRGLDAMMGWYESEGPNRISSPTCLHAQLGDLFIHRYGNSSVQIWLSNGSDWESNIQDGHHHPVLKDHRLCVREGGEPSWVTRKTLATYKTRGRTKDGIKTAFLLTETLPAPHAIYLSQSSKS
ncbi:hypothetical protein C8R48DRAFT_671715 [Suillus tomentosus]|nr:hypothetical protein C8R48DRAFT_671715 [Suillus tomentosus]